MPSTDFDRLFLHLPPVIRETDYGQFWDNAIMQMKKIPVDGEIRPNAHRTSARFNVSDVTFTSASRTKVYGFLYMPRAVEKPHPVIIIHDYNHPEPYKGFDLDDHMAYFFLRLRGHQNIKEPHAVETKIPAPPPSKSSKKKPVIDEDRLPGYLREKILDPENYYVKAVYLDALRSIDLLRLNRKLDCGAIGIIGKGLGAAAGLFAASRSERITAMVIDSPLFTYLDVSQNESDGDIATEINDYIKINLSKRALVKRSLSYFDTLTFADKIKCDVMMSIGLKDPIAPPQCSFALFNHLLCDKLVQVYPDDGNEPGGDVQFKKVLKWLRKRVS
jgi:cephalosporin-C deacetylase